MILYFANRQMEILGNASTHLPDGIRIVDDNTIEDVESGVASFECYLPYTKETREKLEACVEAGNYIFKNYNDETSFFTIIETETNTRNQEIYIYAEDAGLDLLNEVVSPYEADKAYPISHYINKFAYDAGFKIKINEVDGLTRKLSWDAEETATARIASVAAQFDNCEISYSFNISGLKIKNKYINIHEKRGTDDGVQLRLNRDIDKIIATKSIANIATALQCEGGTPEDKDDPITLSGYTYDDGDFFVSGKRLYSRKAIEKWGRYVWEDEPNQILGDCGHIVQQFDDTTTSQATLCKRAIAELKKLREAELNFEVDICKLPDNVKIGDRVNIIDEAGELYLSTRILKLEHSVTKQKHNATLGEYLIKGDGIAKSVKNLASKFAKQTVSVQRANQAAATAKEAAATAQLKAAAAETVATTAQAVAIEAQTAAGTAAQSATNAAAQAQAAQATADAAIESVSSIEQSVENAQKAVEDAQAAADIASQNAETASQAAQNATDDANTAKETAETAKSTADNALSKAEQAQNSIDESLENSQAAIETAIAAKLDAEEAAKDVDALGDTLESVTDTMRTDYARKTDLTETEATLQAQITRNAAKVESSVYKLMTIDETANNASSLLEAAQKAADLAQEQADEATAEAQAAQLAADESLAAANDAQAEADTAKAAYEEAKAVVEQAEADLLAAKKDLATIEARADAAEEEIAAAQAAVTAAQTALNNSKNELNAAKAVAENAQSVADDAVKNAKNAQAAANDAVNKANLAQEVADEAKGNADNAKTIAEQAISKAEWAQTTADNAAATAETAQATANEAKSTLDELLAIVDDNTERLKQAEKDLADAEANLENLRLSAEATEEEITAAENAVAEAQTVVAQMVEYVNLSQVAADNARANAEAAQAAADEAKKAADEAQSGVAEAQRAADEAQGIVYSLAKRTVENQTRIEQNSSELLLTVEELTKKVTNDETVIESLKSQIQQLSTSISMLVTGADGESLMIQTADGWSFNFKAIQKDIENLSEGLSKINSSISLGKNEDGQPVIELKVDDNVFRALITNTGIHFLEGAQSPTSIEDGVLNTEKALIKEELQFPQDNSTFVWRRQANGNLRLEWEGGVS